MRLKEIKPGMVIHCKTEEEKEILIGELDRLGYVWCTGDRVAHLDVGKKVDTVCYSIGSDKKLTWSFYSEQSSKTVTEFSDLIIPELSAKEVLETIYEICDNHKCTGCPLKNCCPTSSKGTNYSDAIEICTKWREEHPKEEKKELETEWVYVVRIIKVENNGFKKCVYEEDFPALIEKTVVEDVLKNYRYEHDGNFFAALEHICRIKE